MNIGTFRASELLADADLTLHFTVVKDLRFRLGLWVMCLGGRLMGARVKVEIASPDDGAAADSEGDDPWR